MNTKRIGNIGEAKTICKFAELGIPVYTSFGDNEKSDMIADINGSLKRIQCKTCRVVKDGKFTARLIKGKNIHSVYKREEVDYFSIYNIDSDTLILVPFESAGVKELTIRLEEPKSKNGKVTKMYYDYLFEKIII